MRKRVAILGSTGSIGTQALEVVSANPDRFEVVALAAGGNDPGLLARQALEHEVSMVAVAKASAAQDVQLALYAEAQKLILDNNLANTVTVDVLEPVRELVSFSFWLKMALVALGAAAIYGHVTKRSLAGLGGLLFMGVIGLLVALLFVVNPDAEQVTLLADAAGL